MEYAPRCHGPAIGKLLDEGLPHRLTRLLPLRRGHQPDHPEKSGAVTYSSYDARGHAGRVIDGPNDLTFTWDGAERLTQVKETGSGGRVLKTFSYASSNGTGDWRRGKLQVARRYNHPLIGSTPYTVDVAETYTYGGKQGRVSKRDTAVAVNGGAAESFTQSWAWNDLGNLASVTYPKCTHTGCTAATNRTVSSTYTNGFLTGVTGYASSISYHLNGQVNQIVRANNTTDTYVKDPQNQLRPNKIDTKVTSTGAIVWSSGIYSYDGAGNVVKTGSSYFLHDGVSRIDSGTLYTGYGGGATGPEPFDHAYDGFGNLQSMTSDGILRNTPTSSGSNRPTEPGGISGPASASTGEESGVDAREIGHRYPILRPETSAEHTSESEQVHDSTLLTLDIIRNRCPGTPVALRFCLRTRGETVQTLRIPRAPAAFGALGSPS